MKCYLFHDVVLSDVDLDFSIAYCESSSGDEGDWAREKFRRLSSNLNITSWAKTVTSTRRHHADVNVTRPR